MLKVPFNGSVLVTQPYRSVKDPKGPHYGTDYAILHRTALVAPTDGIISACEKDITKKTPKGIRSWLANTPSDPFIKLKAGSIIKYRALSTTDYGNFVKINHGQNISTLCSHLDEVCVEVGQVVKEGELIGYSDSSGNSTGSHLHYEIRRKDIVIDPKGFDYKFQGSVAASDAITPAASNVVSKEFIEKRLKEYTGNYWPCDKVVRIRDDGTFSLLYVRNKPSTKTGLLSGFTKTFLKPGNIVNTIYFGEGQDIEGKNIWWMSEYGNFFWAGGTEEYPQIEEDLQSLISPSLQGGEKVLTQVEKDELLAKELAEHETKIAEINEQPIDSEPAVVPAVEPTVSVESGPVETQPEPSLMDKFNAIVEEFRVKVLELLK